MDNKQSTLELGTKPVGKLLMQYALPAIIAMTAASLYNMVHYLPVYESVGSFRCSGGRGSVYLSVGKARTERL